MPVPPHAWDGSPGQVKEHSLADSGVSFEGEGGELPHQHSMSISCLLVHSELKTKKWRGDKRRTVFGPSKNIPFCETIFLALPILVSVLLCRGINQLRR